MLTALKKNKTTIFNALVLMMSLAGASTERELSPVEEKAALATIESWAGQRKCMCVPVCVRACACARKTMWDSLGMIGPFHEGLCCRWLSAVLGLALIPPALVSDPMSSISGIWGGGGVNLQHLLGCSSSLVQEKKRKSRRQAGLSQAGCSYSQLWVMELDWLFRVLMTLITASEEALALRNLKAVPLFPQSASLRNFVYLLRL